MVDRVIFISALMILSLTAAARHPHLGAVVADTSVLPTKKIVVNHRPVAEKAGTKTSGDVPSKKHPATGKAAGVKTVVTDKNGNTAKKNTGNGSGAGQKTGEKNNVKTVAKTTAGGANTKPGARAAGNKAIINSKEKSAGKTGAAKAGAKSIPVRNEEKNTTNKKSPVAGTKLAALTPAETNRTSARTAKPKSRTLRKGIGIELYQPLAFKYAILLDVPVEKVTDDRLLEVLDHWYGTRYRYGGETRRGIDCSAFTQAFMRSYFDYELPRTSEEQYTSSKHIKKRKLRQGDLVFFKTRGSKGGITHVGVYLVNNRFVHSATSSGVRISDLDEDYYKERYAGAGRIR